MPSLNKGQGKINMTKVKPNKIVGIICAVINLAWIIFFAYFFFAYRFCNMLWLVMIPDRILIFNMMIGIIGLYLSLLLFRERLKMKKFLIIEIFLFLIGFLILRY